MTALRHVGLSLGRVEHWHDGLGEYSRRLVGELAARAPELRAQHGIALHVHLPARWHGMFGHEVNYLSIHTTQRVLHLRSTRFAIWHRLHQHIRLRPPWRTERRVETVHDLNFLYTKHGAKRERYRRRLRERLRGCARVVVISRHVRDELLRELGDAGLPVQVIHNGATDLTTLPRKPVPLPGGDGAPFLLHISRMAPSKNIEALLAMAAAWPQQRLVLAGSSSPYTDHVRGQIATRSLSNVTLAMDIDDEQKAWLYAHCSGFLFPSLTEGFGLPPLEAMHFGKPVFLSRLTSLPEVGGMAATYFDDFDPQRMRERVAATLGTFAADDARRAREQAASFSWQRCTEQHVDLYRGLLPPWSGARA
ncbi:MAG TPA: glycosyltransferase family 1 protein [Burkholderiaceae bacterium]|nr:glycosyltransferase family 1 protein [Burkholderiaceae bacterium]